MGDVTKFPRKPSNLTLVTGKVPSENPDAPHLRGMSVEEALHRLGFGQHIPHTQGSRRVGVATLKELRDQHLAWARLLTEIIGDGGPPDLDPRSGAA